MHTWLVVITLLSQNGVRSLAGICASVQASECVSKVSASVPGDARVLKVDVHEAPGWVFIAQPSK